MFQKEPISTWGSSALGKGQPQRIFPDKLNKTGDLIKKQNNLSMKLDDSLHVKMIIVTCIPWELRLQIISQNLHFHFLCGIAWDCMGIFIELFTFHVSIHSLVGNISQVQITKMYLLRLKSFYNNTLGPAFLWVSKTCNSLCYWK